VRTVASPDVIDLRSDTVTVPTPAMRAAIAGAVVGDEQKREDPTVLELERRVAELLGQEAAVFLPTATMANQVALKLHGRPGDVLLAEESSHVLVFEYGGAAAHAGLMTRGLPGVAGRVSAEQVREEAAPSAKGADQRVTVVSLEDTHNNAGGRVWPLDELEEVVSTARDTHGRPTVVELVRSRRRLYPVGRLDADSTGLILLTNDGELADLLTHPRYGVEKVYRARIQPGRVSPRALAALRQGVRLEDGPTQPARVRQVAPGLVEIAVREGRKHQVRRMFEAVGHRVVELERVAFGPLGLRGLQLGKSRRLKDAEVERLRRAAGPKRSP